MGRGLRQAMAVCGIAGLPLYFEDRACKTLAVARVLGGLAPVARAVACHRRDSVKVVGR